MNEADRYLPGDPSKLLIRKVRRQLKSYGITPQPKQWRLTWMWAAEIANSYRWARKDNRADWPSFAGIAAQYVLLLMADMQQSAALYLPSRARGKMPPAVAAALLPGAQAHALPEALAEPLALPAHDPGLFTPTEGQA